MMLNSQPNGAEPVGPGALTANAAVPSDSNASAIASLAADELPERFFRDCCGQSGLRVMVEVPGQAHPRLRDIDQPCLIIGRDATCDMRVDHPDVAPRHAYLQWIEGRIYGFSLTTPEPGKPSGGWISRKPVTIGPLRISIPEFDLPIGPDDPQSRSAVLAADVPQVQLKFSGVAERDNLWPVDRRLTLIGRAPACRLRLDHPQIPLVLASLIRTASSCWLLDLSGADQLRVNGLPVKAVSLDVGDAIQMGPFAAEVSTTPYSPKPFAEIPATTAEPSAVSELAVRHRQRVGTLNKSLEAVKLFLDEEHLNVVPELKTALQRYISQAQKHHREIQDAIERLAAAGDVKEPIHTS